MIQKGFKQFVRKCFLNVLFSMSFPPIASSHHHAFLGSVPSSTRTLFPHGV